MMPHDRMSAITLCVSDATQNNRQTARREKAGLDDDHRAARVAAEFSELVLDE
jgi:hypothetical protein